MNRALIIVDVQPTFCEGGALGVTGGNAVAERIAHFISQQGGHYSLIVSTQDWHIDPGAHFSDTPDFVGTWPPHGVAGTPEAELHPALRAVAFNASVKKGQYAAAYSGFYGVDDDGRTRGEILTTAGVKDVDVAGIAESHCVKETALDALKAGLCARVIYDLTVPVDHAQGEAARTEMVIAGVVYVPSEEAAF